jgi:hypothetical protein
MDANMLNVEFNNDSDNINVLFKKNNIDRMCILSTTGKRFRINAHLLRYSRTLQNMLMDTDTTEDTEMDNSDNSTNVSATADTADTDEFIIPIGDQCSDYGIEKVIEFCGIYQELDKPLPDTFDEEQVKLREEHKGFQRNLNSNQSVLSDMDLLTSQDRVFLTLDVVSLLEILQVSNYFDIFYLSQILYKKIASFIEGKTTKQMRHFFRVEDDFTSEERQQLEYEKLLLVD